VIFDNLIAIKSGKKGVPIEQQPAQIYIFYLIFYPFFTYRSAFAQKAKALQKDLPLARQFFNSDIRNYSSRIYPFSSSRSSCS